MSFLLEELGYMLKKDDRFKLYLTNTLEMEELAQTELPGMVSLSEESHLAGRVKREQPILVILGNPPYSGMSANRGKWIDDLLKKGYVRVDGSKDGGYYQVNGNPLGEKNPKWLQDDYVKFIRFAQWKIDQAGEGILGFITNHSYLDNPTFRGMRRSLMNSFNEIYILDLHGNTLRKEKCPDGSKDENVFDIRQGVAIALFIKHSPELVGGRKRNPPIPPLEKGGKGGFDSEVFHSQIWGLREKKYGWLSENNIKTSKWNRLSPKSEFYLFIPRDEKLSEAYEKHLKITDIFPVNSVGIVTARDSFVIDFNKEALKRRIRIFRDEKMPDEIIRQTFNLKDKSNWKLADARKRVGKEENWEESITQILYRPFDVQWIFYHEAVNERPRKEIMRHMLQENIGLILPKRVETKIPWAHVFCATEIIEHVAVSLKTIDYLMPLYIYPDGLFGKKKAEKEERKPNISKVILDALTEVYKKGLSPEEIFHYTYAVLYSNIYRTKYAEFLRIDFPRIPFTKNYKLFSEMGAYGKKLVDLHLLKSNDLDQPITKFQGKGDNKVEKVKYEQDRVYINNDQYFEGISPEVWEYQIGGYQVCDKWLKDRKGRVLSLDDIRHYCKVVTSIGKIIEIQKAIDEIFSEVEKETIEFKF
jgi:predicted helicase